MVRLIIIFFVFIVYSSMIQSKELNTQESMIFNFIDFNKDENISLNEITQSLKIIFELIDENKDGNISKEEIFELKGMIDSLL